MIAPMTAVLDIQPGEVSLTPAGADELPLLARLYVQLYEAHGRKITEDDASVKLGKSLGAGLKSMLFMSRDQAIGFVLWADLGDHVFIRNYVLEPALRGRGLGGALFARFRAEILAPDVAIRLEATADPARRFWQAQGLRAWSTGMRLDPPKEHL